MNTTSKYVAKKTKKKHHNKASGNEMKPETLQTVLNLIKAWMTARLND